ncbi:hypothetical protein DEO72_LG8g2486 [Vigna unguiculata]|uniref:Uncharacterized protein n=1 Tax=Vigna unguiculata TaxID=3917 RepID=A0A4D6MSF6_VIGUN|nr:hypothetical protein DEO72_LG8g2486 [Vigna unguiculata]
MRDLQGFGDTSKADLLVCSLNCSSKVSLELWLEIGVKHVVGLASVVSLSVRVVARTDGSREIALLSFPHVFYKLWLVGVDDVAGGSGEAYS